MIDKSKIVKLIGGEGEHDMFIAADVTPRIGDKVMLVDGSVIIIENEVQLPILLEQKYIVLIPFIPPANGTTSSKP